MFDRLVGGKNHAQYNVAMRVMAAGFTGVSGIRFLYNLKAFVGLSGFVNVLAVNFGG
jgi:hypothetical protein